MVCKEIGFLIGSFLAGTCSCSSTSRLATSTTPNHSNNFFSFPFQVSQFSLLTSKRVYVFWIFLEESYIQMYCSTFFIWLNYPQIRRDPSSWKPFDHLSGVFLTTVCKLIVLSINLGKEIVIIRWFVEQLGSYSLIFALNFELRISIFFFYPLQVC